MEVNVVRGDCTVETPAVNFVDSEVNIAGPRTAIERTIDRSTVPWLVFCFSDNHYLTVGGLQNYGNQMTVKLTHTAPRDGTVGYRAQTYHRISIDKRLSDVYTGKEKVARADMTVVDRKDLNEEDLLSRAEVMIAYIAH